MGVLKQSFILLDCHCRGLEKKNSKADQTILDSRCSAWLELIKTTARRDNPDLVVGEPAPIGLGEVDGEEGLEAAPDEDDNYDDDDDDDDDEDEAGADEYDSYDNDDDDEDEATPAQLAAVGLLPGGGVHHPEERLHRVHPAMGRPSAIRPSTV